MKEIEVKLNRNDCIVILKAIDFFGWKLVEFTAVSELLKKIKPVFETLSAEVSNVDKGDGKAE